MFSFSMFSSAKAARKSPAQQGSPGNISSIVDQTTPGGTREHSEVKKAIWKDSMLESWAQVLDALKEKTELVGALGSEVGLTRT